MYLALFDYIAHAITPMALVHLNQFIHDFGIRQKIASPILSRIYYRMLYLHEHFWERKVVCDKIGSTLEVRFHKHAINGSIV